MKFAVLLLAAVSLLGQAPKSQEITFAFTVLPERPGISDVHRDAAEVLFEGFKSALLGALGTTVQGSTEKKYFVFVELLPRTKYLDPQYVAVFIQEAGKQRTELHRFELTLRTNLPAEGLATGVKIALVVKPTGAGKK